MGLKHFAIGIVIASGAIGCATSPRTSPDVGHWVAKVPPGTTADDARKILGENGFESWTNGNVIYVNRDPDWPVPESNGTTAAIHLDPAGRVAWTEFYNSPGHDYPLLAPTYPSP